MKVHETPLPGVLIVEPRVFRDERGFFIEAFNDERFRSAGLPAVFRQDNHSRSSRDVLRGLHYQLAHPQGKLVSVIRGAIFDVAADIRVGAPTFGQWFGIELHEDDARSLWVPPGFAHGFCALADTVDVVYKCTDVYHADDDHGVAWNDPTLAIAWPVTSPRISDKDALYPLLDLSRNDLPRYEA
ncbi:MAG: dTDP-4-dehydrorhamnose 3,5-epimerase [Gemmatimonadaceae bacterium]|nr:dTDP-4-dehydrorhamnose 3,5-epimerase [Gemmatimonadaceae bacterium]